MRLLCLRDSRERKKSGKGSLQGCNPQSFWRDCDHGFPAVEVHSHLHLRLYRNTPFRILRNVAPKLGHTVETARGSLRVWAVCMVGSQAEVLPKKSVEEVQMLCALCATGLWAAEAMLSNATHQRIKNQKTTPNVMQRSPGRNIYRLCLWVSEQTVKDGFKAQILFKDN